MTIQEFKDEATVEKVCTTNDWGFGGYSGKFYRLDHIAFRKARWFYRHARPSNYDGYFVNDIEVTKNDFVEQLKTITL